MNDGLIEGPDGKVRCWWHGNDPEYMRYHDEEWGHPIDDDQRLFEKISLEGFQAGLSWLTILRKRENFRKAFDHFDYKKIQKYDEKKIEALLQNAGIIRHRGKIEAVINNAQQMNELLEEYSSFASYIWSFEPSDEERPKKFDYATLSKITQSEASKKLSKDLKKRGWKFVGPTTCYAFMQSMGIVNDHVEGCYCREIIEKKRAAFKRPS
ncbi:MAG: DNA-3-methyladenine glycosylase I [Pseudomonadota bacterium]